jgi:hypothetical protein
MFLHLAMRLRLFKTVDREEAKHPARSHLRHHVKLLSALFIFPIFAGMSFAQVPSKIVTFNRADTEHCKVIVVSGKPLLQSTNDGTSVAIAMPINRANGDFSVFVSISRAQHGTAHVDPQSFYGVYSDNNHTRFRFYDKAREIESVAHTQDGNAQTSASNSQIDPGSMRPGAVQGGPPPGGGSEAGGPPMMDGRNVPSAYLRKSKVKSGSGVAGWITLRQPKGANLNVHPADMLDEIDVPIDGVLFRF